MIGLLNRRLSGRVGPMNIRSAFEKGNNGKTQKTGTTSTPSATLFRVNDFVLPKLATENTPCTAGIVASIFIEPHGRNAETKKPQRVFYAVRGGSGWPMVEERARRFSPMSEDLRKLPVSTKYSQCDSHLLFVMVSF
jgi:hypothetical protein